MRTTAIIATITLVSLRAALLAQTPTVSVTAPAPTLTPTAMAAPSPPTLTALSSSPAGTPATKTSSDAVVEYQRILAEQSKQYQEFLRAETDRHQEFLKAVFTIIAWAVGVAATAFLSFLAWFNFSTRRDAVQQITGEVQQITGELKLKVEAAVAEKLSEFESHVGTSKTAVDKQVDDVKKSWADRLTTFEEEYDTKLTQLRTHTDDELTTIAEYASVIGHAAVVLGAEESKDPPELRARTRAAVAEKLEALQQKVPTHRTVTVFTARIFRFMDELERSIKVLERSLEARKKCGLVSGPDQGALLYNKACYQNILAKKKGDAALQNQAWDCFREAVQLDPSNLDEAKVDPDLMDIVESGGRKWDDLTKQKPG